MGVGGSSVTRPTRAARRRVDLADVRPEELPGAQQQDEQTAGREEQQGGEEEAGSAGGSERGSGGDSSSTRQPQQRPAQQDARVRPEELPGAQQQDEQTASREEQQDGEEEAGSAGGSGRGSGGDSSSAHQPQKRPAQQGACEATQLGAQQQEDEQAGGEEEERADSARVDDASGADDTGDAGRAAAGHTRTKRQRLELVEVQAADLHAVQQQGGVEGCEEEEGEASERGEPSGASGGDERRQAVRSYIRKADWLDQSRWRSYTIDIDTGIDNDTGIDIDTGDQGEKRIYFRKNDGEWEERFVIKQSQLGSAAGMGVYAARPFKVGETLTYYGGEDLGKAGSGEGERALAEARKGEAARYILELQGSYVKPDLKGINPAHMFNDAGAEHANAVCKGGGEVKAKKAIRIGQEVFWCYGERYWRYWKKMGGRLMLPKAPTAGAGRDDSRKRKRGTAGQAGQPVDRGGEQRLSGEPGATRELRRRVSGRVVRDEGVT